MGPPVSLLFSSSLLPPISTINWSTQICTLQMSETHTLNAHILCHPSGKKDHAGSCMDVSFDFFVWNSRKILFKNPQLNLGCLTEMHTNTAIIGGRKLYSVAVANSLVQWNKALCCYVKVSACNCCGCFEGFIIYIFLCFSKGAYQAAVPAGRWGGGGGLTKGTVPQSRL